MNSAITTQTTAADAAFMAVALELARAGLGQTAPNPSVGAIVVKDGRIAGRGVTAPGGRPHAETEALKDAGAASRGATLYVTLEPCCHHGKTGPCADAVIAAGITRVVSALEDPDPRVSGRGHAKLRAAGIDVVTGVMAAEARRANLGYILRVTQGRPMVTLKLAETLDSYVAGDEHDPRLMITGQAANTLTHEMRASHDAIMAGIGTVLADDPLMSVRHERFPGRKPLRIVLDARLALPPRSRLAETAGGFPTLVLCTGWASPDRAAVLATRGIEVEQTGADGPRLDLAAALQALGTRGLTRVLCEGGPRIAAALIAQGLADELVLFTAPKLLARPGVPGMSDETRNILARKYALVEDGWCGADRLRRYERRG